PGAQAPAGAGQPWRRAGVLRAAGSAVGPPDLGPIHLRGNQPGHRRAHLVVFDLAARAVGDHRAAHAGLPDAAAGPGMIAALLFAVFAGLMVIGVPVGVALGVAGSLAIALANADVQWFGLLA